MNEIEATNALKSYYGILLPAEAARFAAWWGGDEHRHAQFEKHFLCDICIDRAIFGIFESPLENLPSYATDPPELVAMFGGYTRYGYLGLAPEVDMRLPFVCSNPNMYDLPVYIWAANFGEGLEHHLSRPLTPEFDLREVFGRALQRREFRSGMPRDFRDALIIPDGYRYERGSDVTGVLAPTEAFKDDSRPVAEDDDFDEHLRYAEKCIRDGQPASAILVLRDIRTVLLLTEGVHWPPYETVLKLWSSAARSLGREGQAKTLDRMIDEHLRALLSK
jgi:hypothetical protein